MDWARIGAGVATGGASETTNLLSGGALFGGGGSTEQVPLETQEQKYARKLLMNFADTGKFGDFTAGAEIPLKYGDYTATNLENQGQSQLQQLLNEGIPDQYRLGDEALKGFLTNDPAEIQKQFDPFRAQVSRQMQEADTNLKRGAGFAGNLYSTDTIRKLGDVQARGNETLTAELARLTNASLDRKMGAIPLAYQSAQAQQGAKLEQISASQTYGALTRQLNDASIKARDAELLRRRTELKMPIDAAMAVAGSNTQFGVPSVQNSPYQELLGMVGQIGGTAIGYSMGGPMGGAVGGSVGKTVGGTAGGMASGGGSNPRNVFVPR